MNLYSIKCLMLTKNNNIKIKRKIDDKKIFIMFAIIVALKSLKY